MASFDKRPSLSPAPGLQLGASSPAQQRFRENSRTMAGLEQGRDVQLIKNFLDQYADAQITIAGTTYTVLARRGFSDGPAISEGIEPWYCEKLETRTMRVYPSSIGDGLGNYIWPIYSGSGTAIRSTPESRFDIPIPLNPLTGWLWVECTVDDTNDLHGELVEAELKIGAAPVNGFQSRTGTTVNIPIAEYASIAPNTPIFTLNPRRNFNLVLRRFGPPGSSTWDVEIS